MRPISLTIREIPSESGVGTEREVLADGFRTGHLGLDEALGCIASWLYGNKESLPQFMCSDLHHARGQRRHGLRLDERSIVALRLAGEPLERCAACAGRGDIQAGEDGTILGIWKPCAACCGKGWVG